MLPKPIATPSRRTIFLSAAAITSFGVVRKIDGRFPKATLPALPDAASAVAAPCPSFATSPKLAEIANRNLLRQKAGLPLLSVAQEFRLMKNAEAIERFATFAAAYRSRVHERLLARVRRQLGNVEWKPTGMNAMGFQTNVTKELRRLYEFGSEAG
jgi:hypothetical protein